MPYKCSKCGEPIIEEQVAKTVEKFGNALCNKCILARNHSQMQKFPLNKLRVQNAVES
jgi:DNA-directed RNA polymerase subunit RPC12/RpoP